MLDRLITEVGALAQSEKLKTERYVREQRALDEQVPGIWTRLRAAIKAKCEQYPEHFKFDVCVQDEAVVRGSNRKVLEVKFLSDSKIVAFECCGATGFCTFQLNRQNMAVICDQDGVLYPSEEHAADQLLAVLLRQSRSMG